MLRLLGAGLLLGGAWLGGVLYARERCARLLEHEAFLALLEQLRREVGEHLRPMPAICLRVQDARLRPSGFLTALHRERSLAAALRQSEGTLRLSPGARQLLRECFEGFGEGYRDGEVQRLGNYADRLRGMVEAERDESARSVRLFRVLLVFGALLAVLLLL